MATAGARTGRGGAVFERALRAGQHQQGGRQLQRHASLRSRLAHRRNYRCC